MQEVSLNDFSLKVSEKTGASVLKIEAIIEGYQNQIRKSDSLSVTGELIIQIPLIAKEYGTRFDIHENVTLEAIRLMFRKFPFIGVNEIREAYREYYSGNSSAKGADAYGGEFSVAQLGKILTAYVSSRQAILAKYLKLKEEKEELELERKLHEKKQQEFERMFPEEVVKTFSSVEVWSDVPVHYWKIFKKNKFVSFEGNEAKVYFRLARIVATREMKRLQGERDLRSMSQRMKFKIPEFDVLAKTIAGQLTLWYKCIKNEEWLIDFSERHEIFLPSK